MKITDMTTSHIVNRIAWLKRNMPDHWAIHGDELPSASLVRAEIDDDIEAYEQEIHKLEAELEKRQSSNTWGRE